MFILFAPLLLIPLTAARDIVFPQSSGFDQQPVFGQNGIDISTGSAFAGLTTYANLPYVHCLAAKDEEIGKYDIAILGAPFDTVSSLFFSVLGCVEHGFQSDRLDSEGRIRGPKLGRGRDLSICNMLRKASIRGCGMELIGWPLPRRKAPFFKSWNGIGTIQGSSALP
jgi:hypothetical protein